MSRNDGYDHNHATSNTQFLALLIVVAMCAGVGLTLGLIMLLILT